MIRKWLSCLCMVLILLAGCGSGSEEGESPKRSVLYSGNTAEATVTSGNAREISSMAWRGGSLASSVNPNAGAQVQTATGGQSLAVNLPQALKEILNKIDLEPEKLFINATKDVSDTLVGSCGGSASFSLRYDDQTGFFSGTLAFKSYCAYDATLTGHAEFSGFISLSTGQFISLALSMNTLTAASGNERYTLKGDLQAVYATSPRTVTCNILARDDVSGKVYWWNNLTVRTAGASDDADLSLDGRIYHPDYGYVTVSTATPFRINPAAAAPSSGMLLITGQAGPAGGSTAASFTALSATSYSIDADTDGDGLYDWSSETLYW